MLAEKGPHILDQDISFFSAYHDKKVLEPINLEVFGGASLDDIRAQYIGNVIEGVTFDDNIYGLPYQTNSMSYVHNLNAYKEAGQSNPVWKYFSNFNLHSGGLSPGSCGYSLEVPVL